MIHKIKNIISDIDGMEDITLAVSELDGHIEVELSTVDDTPLHLKNIMAVADDKIVQANLPIQIRNAGVIREYKEDHSVYLGRMVYGQV